MITHKEYSIKILAPNEIQRCGHLLCRKEGEWAIHIEDDKGKCQVHVDNLCEKHLLFYIIDSLADIY